jgi:hypothetical protein
MAFGGCDGMSGDEFLGSIIELLLYNNWACGSGQPDFQKKASKQKTDR